MKKILTIAFLFSSLIVNATRYYVSSSDGSDSDTGLTEALAWATIAKVNAQTFSPGDIISFKCGDTWRETLVIPNSGASGSYITFNSFGTGEKPLILGSNVSAGWTDMGGNVWRSSSTFSVNPWVSSTYYSEIFFYSGTTVTWPVHVASTAALVAEYQWTWASNYIYIYSPADPGSRYTKIEIPQRNYCVSVGNTNQYIAIDGLDIRHAKNINVYDNDPETSLTGFTIQNCHLSYVGSRDQATGYNLAVCRNDLLIKDNHIFEGGRRQISIHVYDADNLTFSNIIIDGNECHDGYHGSGFGIAMDGSRVNNKFREIIVRNNLFYDRTTRDPDSDGWDQSSLGAIRAEESGATIENVQVYNNVFKYPNSYALSLTNVDTVSVYNNTFYNFNLNTTTVYCYHILIGTSNTQMKIKNNIFYGTQVYSTTGKTMSIVVESGQDMAQIELDYNLFYEADTYMTVIQVKGTNYRSTTWATLKTAYPTFQVHEPGLVNPQFADAPTNVQLAEGSPAIGAGVGVGLTTDYSGNAFASTPSIGAYEYDATPPTPTDLATVVTNTVSDILPYSATCGGNVTNDGGGTISARGVCWSMSASPTITDSHTSDGTGTGSYTSSVTGLRPGTTYHIRSYATNESGTSYGADVLFSVPVFRLKINGSFIKVNNKFVKL